MPVASEFDLLCEACGYRLEGLGSGGVCPECARPVVESLPQRRRGTPAQRAATAGRLLPLKPLVATVWLTLRSIRSPRMLWDDARVGDEADERIKGGMLLCAAVLMTGSFLCVYLIQAILALGLVAGLVVGAWWLFYGLMAVIVIWLALNGLTWLEKTGIRTFGRMHGRRITPAVAMTIVSHASAGWVVGAALLTPAWLLGRGLAAAADDVSFLRWQLVYMLPVILPIAAGLLGMLLFEVITWQGVMRLRYANRARPWESGRPPGAGPTLRRPGVEASAGVER